jgi:flagellar basal-body rod protein FlgB
MIGSTKSMNLLINKMGWQVARSERFSQNIANVDTPGYKRVDIAPFDQIVKEMNGQNNITSSIRDIQSDAEITREGEIMNLTETVSNYQSNLHIFKKYLGLLKTVIGKTGG